MVEMIEIEMEMERVECREGAHQQKHHGTIEEYQLIFKQQITYHPSKQYKTKTKKTKSKTKFFFKSPKCDPFQSIPIHSDPFRSVPIRSDPS